MKINNNERKNENAKSFKCFDTFVQMAETDDSLTPFFASTHNFRILLNNVLRMKFTQFFLFVWKIIAHFKLAIIQIVQYFGNQHTCCSRNTFWTPIISYSVFFLSRILAAG